MVHTEGIAIHSSMLLTVESERAYKVRDNMQFGVFMLSFGEVSPGAENEALACAGILTQAAKHPAFKSIT